MMYKIIHNIVHIQPDIPLTYSKAVNTRGHHLKMLQPATRIDAYLHSLFFSSEVNHVARLTPAFTSFVQ